MYSFLFIDTEWIFAFLINAILVSAAHKLPLLTRGGWINAGILGTILFGCLGWEGWLSVIVYLVLGSLVTKLGYKYKKSAGIAEARGGRRGAENVWGSAATGACLALLIKAGVEPSNYLLIGFAASFSAKLSDTFGSEIGKRWGKNPILITTLKPAKPGTDGAVTLEGTFASLLGSVLMTTIMVGLFHSRIGNYGFIILISGFLATILESFLGALLQKKYTWLTNELVNSIQTSIASLIAIGLVYSFEM